MAADIVGGASGAAKGAAAGSVAGPIGSTVGGILGGIGGMFFGNKSAAIEKAAWDDYIKMLQSQGILNPEDYVPDYEDLDPAQMEKYLALNEQAVTQGDTELASVQTNPMYKEAMQNALAKYQRQSEEGLTVADEADRNALLRGVATQQRGDQQAITQGMQRRGMLGSGGELAARLASSGQDYAAAAAEGEALAKARLQAKQQALANSTNLAGNMDATEYNRAKGIADARDNINRFNVGQQTGVNQRNTAAQQGASDSNVGVANNVYKSNTGTHNQAAEARVGGVIANNNAMNQQSKDIGDAKLKKAGVGAEQAKNMGSGVAQLGSLAGDFVSKYWG